MICRSFSHEGIKDRLTLLSVLRSICCRLWTRLLGLSNYAFTTLQLHMTILMAVVVLNIFLLRAFWWLSIGILLRRPRALIVACILMNRVSLKSWCAWRWVSTTAELLFPVSNLAVKALCRDWKKIHQHEWKQCWEFQQSAHRKTVNSSGWSLPCLLPLCVRWLPIDLECPWFYWDDREDHVLEEHTTLIRGFM